MESTVASSKMQRRKQGKALREKLPRTAQAAWKPRSKSQDIVKLLEESDVDRIAGLLPVKYQRMAVDGRRKIKDSPPVIYHFDEYAKNLERGHARFIEEYKKSLQHDRRHLLERYQLQDSAIKVVGVGSVGTRCYLALLVADEVDPLFLQVKEARRSVLERPNGRSRYAHQGLRVVEGQRLMQGASDIFLGWARTKKHDYYLRQFRDIKVSAEIETFRSGTLVSYATMCGWALARAHAKAGDAAMIAGYL
jgi:uncharacterized protein (DUF2252 family)